MWVYAFLNPELGGGETKFTRQWLYSRVRAPWRMEGRVGARVGLNAVEKRKTSTFAGNQRPAGRICWKILSCDFVELPL